MNAPAQKTNGKGIPVCLRCASGVVDPIRGKTVVAGRNDRCPCGSGRKFKVCCIKKG